MVIKSGDSGKDRKFREYPVVFYRLTRNSEAALILINARTYERKLSALSSSQ